MTQGPFSEALQHRNLVRALRQSALRNMADYLRNYNDASHGMNFIPLSVKRILDKSANNADVRANGHYCVGESALLLQKGVPANSRAGVPTLFSQFYFLDVWRMLRRTFAGHEVYFSC
jgi:hypothetical protein